MKLELMKSVAFCIVALLIAMTPVNQIAAHGGGNWDPFTIDGVNDNARGRILEVQGLLSEIIRGRTGGDKWPPANFRQTRDALITVKEEVDEVLEHYVIDGRNIQVAAELHAEPRAGRSVAASGGLNAAIALIDHAVSLDSADTFIQDFYAAGLAARLYELLGAHLDRMDLYSVLTAHEE